MANEATVSNAEDAYLEAKSRFDAFIQEFNFSWFKPQVDTAKKLFWAKQPENVKAQLRQMSPAGANELDQMMNGGRK